MLHYVDMFINQLLLKGNSEKGLDMSEVKVNPAPGQHLLILTVV